MSHPMTVCLGARDFFLARTSHEVLAGGSLPSPRPPCPLPLALFQGGQAYAQNRLADVPTRELERAPLRILVVGDKAHERDLMVAVVSELGHEVEQAVNGEEALRAYQAGDFDLVISDFVMPFMDGLQLCQAIRAQPKEHYTYVLIVSRLSEKQHIMAGFEAGVDDYVEKPLDSNELRVRLISAVRVSAIHRELADKNRELARLSEDLMAQSRRDPLTQVGNRLRFQDDVAGFVDEVRRYGHRFCLGMCDIDNFKLYNDTYGHLPGDEVLRKVAQVLAQGCRASDHVYRMGGEEFLIVLADQDEANAMIAADRLRQEVADLQVTHDRNAPHGKVTLSIGLTPFLATSQLEVERDLQVADRLLYHAKASGRNRVVTAQIEALDLAAQSATAVSNLSYSGARELQE